MENILTTRLLSVQLYWTGWPYSLPAEERGSRWTGPEQQNFFQFSPIYLSYKIDENQMSATHAV